MRVKSASIPKCSLEGEAEGSKQLLLGTCLQLVALGFLDMQSFKRKPDTLSHVAVVAFSWVISCCFQNFSIRTNSLPTLV